jgi:hypothetical protein
MFVPFEITPDWALALYVAITSLIFDYFPGLAAWFDLLAVEKKRLITLASVIVITAVAITGSCLGWWLTNLVCNTASIIRILIDLIMAVAVMYGFHKATKPSPALKQTMWPRASQPAIKRK